jgi:hypothetical protein
MRMGMIVRMKMASFSSSSSVRTCQGGEPRIRGHMILVLRTLSISSHVLMFSTLPRVR